MANVKTLERSFAGGEVTPEFFGRIDDVKYQTGAAKMRNFIALPHGPAVNRPGFAFVREVKNSGAATRLIPFTYSNDQTFVIELGAGYFRFHTQGATLLNGGVPFEVVNPFSAADIFGIHYVQSADVLTLVHPNYPPSELRRLSALTWTLTTIVFGSTLVAPTSAATVATLASSPTSLVPYNYLVTAVGSNGLDESPQSSTALGPVDAITGITQANPAVITVATANQFSIGQKLDISGVLGMTQINGASYVVASVPSATTITISSGGVLVNSTGFTAYTSGGVAQPYGVTNNLFQTGAMNTISWAAVTGANRYKVYKQSNGLYGYIGITDGLSFVDNNITANIAQTPPVGNNPLSGAGNYPSSVSYFQQRRVFGGSVNSPQNIWMTRSGTESDMNYTLPSRDDNAITFRIAAREANNIRHIVPLSNLVLLTGSAEWRVTTSNTDVLTPSSVGVSPQSYIGANNVQPIIVNNSLLYAAARGGHIREMAYAWQANGYSTGDVSLRAPHLFDGLTIVDMAYAKCPQPICWFVSSNGDLLGLTYVPEQQVGAWHEHDTDGAFESVAVVPEGIDDAVYCIVNRTINGVQKRYVERMASRRFATPADAFFVDSGSTYSGAPVTTISGLDYLEGKTVNILADGAVHPQRTVTGGSITLDNPASTVQVGLPITADLQTLPLALQVDGAFGQGRTKNINKVWLRVYNSGGIFVGPDVDDLTEAKQRTTEIYGTPPSLKSEVIEVDIRNAWDSSGQVWVRQSAPLPLTIVSLSMEVAVGG